MVVAFVVALAPSAEADMVVWVGMRWSYVMSGSSCEYPSREVAS